MLHFLLIPYLIVWLFYIKFAERTVEFMGFQLPRFPIQPGRILKLNYVLIKMIVSYLFGPPARIALILLRNWWKQHTHYVKRNIDFGSRHPTTKLDVYPSASQKQPVIIFFYGGGWGSGSKGLYAPVAHTLSENGYVVVLPDYSIYPKGTAEDMIHDTESAIHWTTQNIDRYGGDPDNIVIISHSAGAHLSVLAVVKHAFACVRAREAMKISKYAREVEAPSSALHTIRGMIMLAGPYDIDDHFNFESRRGVEELSCMGRLFGNSTDIFDKYSPTKLLDPSIAEIKSGSLKEYLPKNWLLLHSLQDGVVPFESTSKLYDRLERIGIPHLVLKSDDDEEHARHVFDLFLGHKRDFMDELNEFYDRCASMGL
jgi:acetyl esterase/lipase